MARRQTEEENLITHTIPENFVDTGRCFHGMFRTRNLIEGGVFAVPLAIFFIESYTSIEDLILQLTLVCGGIMALFLAGINGESVGEFLVNVIRYSKQKRITRYNSRVKSEAAPGYLTKEQNELPRDKILRLIGEFRKRQGQSEDDNAISPDIHDPIFQEFFEDDIGIVDLPDNLKTRAQRKKEARDKKIAEKQRIKEEKQRLKAESKKDKEATKRSRKGKH